MFNGYRMSFWEVGKMAEMDGVNIHLNNHEEGKSYIVNSPTIKEVED